MRAARPVLSGMGCLILLLVSGTGVAGQGQEHDVISSGSAAWVTFVDQECDLQYDTPEQDGDIQRSRGIVATCDVEFSDPRLSGRLTVSAGQDCHAVAGCVGWGAMEIIGPDGSWSGRFNATVDQEFTERGYTVMIGAGDYEGLTFVYHSLAPLNEPPTGSGIIYEGDPPPSG